MFLTCFLLSPCSAQTGKSAEIRQPAVSGQFYPSDAGELKRIVSSLLDDVPPSINQKIDGKIIGIIAPHAGYVFSGHVAAYGFKAVEGKNYDTVVIIGQSHHSYLNKAAIYSGGGFRTPLGDVHTDTELIEQIVKLAGPELVEKNDVPHVPEHSLEVLIPFLQVIMPPDSPHGAVHSERAAARTTTAAENTYKFRIVPILVGQFSIDTCKRIAEKIVETAKTTPGKKILYVISTDMSHYPEYSEAVRADTSALEVLKKYAPKLLAKHNEKLLSKGTRNLSCVLCGEQAVIIGMYVTKMLGANKVNVLQYANSGDIPRYGDKSRVVGYCSVAFVQTGKSASADEHVSPEHGGVIDALLKKKGETKMFSVTDKNQKELLVLARKTIMEFLKTRKPPHYETTDAEITKPAAVFVTLKKKGHLRGCIGTTVPQLPLYETVQRMAAASAFEDHRFSPVSEKELADIKIEISVLSPMTRVQSAEEIIPHKHGVVVRSGGRSGLFLPQVWEHFSNKDEFLGELCSQKAGLKPDAWKDADTELYAFTVFAFEEK
ncbi:MAG: AmmeMemoRadiSam system protein B [Elusimicrobiota bacterium]